MKYEILVNKILEVIGGKENIKSVVHCATRLRFTLVDESKAKDDEVKNIKEVLSLVKNGGQYQLVIGNNVDLVYQELMAITNVTINNTKIKDNRSIIDKTLGAITGSIAPIVSLLAGCGMGKVLLLVLTMLGWLEESSQTYILLDLIFDTGFMFMPVFVGFSAAKMFNTNQYLGAFLGLCLVNPNWASIVKAGDGFSFIGINVPLVKYTATLVPVLMSVWIMSYIEKGVKKVIPDMIKVFAEPLVVAIIAVPLSFVVIAPIGNYISEFVATGSMFLYDHLGFVAIAILAAIYPWLVSVGIHKALSPISITLVAEQGFDPVIRVVALCSNISQAAASLAVSFKTKNKELKSLALSASITAFFGGITEPAMYGVNLKLKKPMYACMIGAAVAGLFAGMVKLKAFIYVTPGILSLAMWVSKEENCIIFAIITLIIATVVTFVATLIIGFDDSAFGEIVQPSKAVLENKKLELVAPTSGQIVALEKVSDTAFSSGIMGKGIAIKPTKGRIIAPCDATITALFHTGHAIGLTTKTGVEILIHIGIDTVSMNGDGFTALVEKGQEIKKGDILITFDIDKIIKNGYDETTMIIITNSNDFLDVVNTNETTVKENDFLLGVL